MLFRSQFSTWRSEGHSSTAQKEDLASKLAFGIMKRAKITSLDHKRDGPFAREAKKYYPRDPFTGGKVDDIAVLVAVAVQAGDAEGVGHVKAKL